MSLTFTTEDDASNSEHQPHLVASARPNGGLPARLTARAQSSMHDVGLRLKGDAKNKELPPSVSLSTLIAALER